MKTTLKIIVVLLLALGAGSLVSAGDQISGLQRAGENNPTIIGEDGNTVRAGWSRTAGTFSASLPTVDVVSLAATAAGTASCTKSTSGTGTMVAGKVYVVSANGAVYLNFYSAVTTTTGLYLTAGAWQKIEATTTAIRCVTAAGPNTAVLNFIAFEER